MTERTSRAIATGARITGDVVRVGILVSGFVVLLWLPGAGIAFFLLFLVLVPPRLLHVAAPFDAAVAVTLLVATWARQQHWYADVPWVDEAVHAVTPGATAVVVYLVLARLDLLPDGREVMGATRRFSLALLVTLVGLALATLWEFVEWVENAYAPQGTHVGYDDTISDLALGGAGSLVAGLCLLWWYRRRGRKDRQDSPAASEDSERPGAALQH